MQLASTVGQLGFVKLAQKLSEKITQRMKLRRAMRRKFLLQEDINAFNVELGKKNKRLILTLIKDYDKLPPSNALIELKKAQDENCFDDFLIAHIENVADPIIFGIIRGLPIFFFIAEWGKDVKFEDVIKFST